MSEFTEDMETGSDSKRLLAQERLERLAQMLYENGSLQVGDLAATLGVSEMTVRRDLNSLARMGKLTRVHGGAVANPGLQFGHRLESNSRAKKAVVRKIADSIPSLGCIYMDGSTTIFGLCDFMDKAQDLQVVTNNLQTFQRLCLVRGVKPIIIGGSLDSRTENLVGAMARKSLNNVRFDVAYMSCYGLDSRLGCMEATLEDAEIKDIVAAQCGRMYVAVDEMKLARSATGAWSHAPSKTVLATNLEPTDERLEPFRVLFPSII